MTNEGTADEAWGLVEDLEHSLKQRERDCAQVREALVPLLEGVYPYSEDIRGDTDKLRAGFVARTAADRIKELEGRVAMLQADVSFRSSVTLGLQFENEQLQRRNEQLTSDMAIRDETNGSWVEYKNQVEADHERLRIRLTEALGLGPDERDRPLHVEQAIEEIKKKTARVVLLEKTTQVRKTLLGRTAERAAEMATELNELRAKELRTPDEWSGVLKIEVRDPDGWRFDRKGESGWKAQEWDVPMTRGEFARRAAASTVRPFEGSIWGRA